MILHSLNLFSQNDTLVTNKFPFDSIQNSTYTGVITLEPSEQLRTHDVFQLYTFNTPKYSYFNFTEGKVDFIDEVQFFKDSSGAITPHHFYSKFYNKNEIGTFTEKQYYDIHQLMQITITKQPHLDTLISEFLFYDRTGRVHSRGQYLNELEQGEFPTYYYNDTIEFTEIWTHGFLTGVDDTRVLFVGEKNKIISQKEYFEIIKLQGGVEWNVFAIPDIKLNNQMKIAFIMYSEQLDFGNLMEKKWHELEFVDLLLKRYEKYLRKMEKVNQNEEIHFTIICKHFTRPMHLY